MSSESLLNGVKDFVALDRVVIVADAVLSPVDDTYLFAAGA